MDGADGESNVDGAEGVSNIYGGRNMDGAAEVRMVHQKMSL